MTVIRHTETRRSETPNAVMTTLASPTLGGTQQSIWRVETIAGAAGPLHVIDREQIWTFLEGGATVELDGEATMVGPGDTVVLPADRPRRLTTDSGYAAIVTAPAGARAGLADSSERSTPPWIA
jgi:quercetin dioxygenase-like cupin family protein